MNSVFKYFHLILISLFLAAPAWAQISPPGLQKTTTAEWLAVGLRQDLDSVTQSLTYIGNGRQSTPGDYNPYQKAAIWVVNQEFYRRIGSDWQYSLALSFRQQYEYSGQAPYESADPAYKHEIRVYGRLTRSVTYPRTRLAATFRQELRKFYGSRFAPWKEDTQLRSRVKFQFTANLNSAKTQNLILTAEPLFSTSHENHQWSPLEYKESRFCAYYSFSPKHTPFIVNLGYMNDLSGIQHPRAVHYVAMDLIWKNPFSAR